MPSDDREKQQQILDDDALLTSFSFPTQQSEKGILQDFDEYFRRLV